MLRLAPACEVLSINWAKHSNPYSLYGRLFSTFVRKRGQESQNGSSCRNASSNGEGNLAGRHNREWGTSRNTKIYLRMWDLQSTGIELKNVTFWCQRIHRCIKAEPHLIQRRVQAAIDGMSSWSSGSSEPTAKDIAEAALQRARDDAVRVRSHRVVTAEEPGLEVLYSKALRNERVPVATVSPYNAEDWGGNWTLRMWGMWLIVPALMGVAYWVLGVERYRWRYGYYHVHQACDWLRDSDPSVRWGALDKVSNVCPQPSLFTEARQAHAEMVQRPEWRRHAAQSGILFSLVDLIEPHILEVGAGREVDNFVQQQVAYNMLVQVLMTINWIMFDEEGERVLHITDLHERLTAALEGPSPWIRWDLARAMARNIKLKLEDPPQRIAPMKFWDRLQAEARAFVHHFPRLPPEWLSGDRIDDPTLGWRGEKIMQKRNAVIEMPGARRRLYRWRSWWNKSEMYPPSVDRWFAVRSNFFRSEGMHLAYRSQDAEKQLVLGFRTAQEGGPWERTVKHVLRGTVLLWCKPIAWPMYRRSSDTNVAH